MAKKPKDSGADAKEKKAADPKSDAPPPEPPAPSPAQDQAPQQAPITINAQYTKDLSFEAPTAPGVFGQLQSARPDVNVDINVNAVPLQDKAFEVILELRSECKVNNETAFILELQYAGVFTLNVPDEHLQVLLLVECPRLLFPFARNILADVSRDGGFPPVMLGPVDFGALYQAKLNELQQAGAPGAAQPDPAG